MVFVFIVIHSVLPTVSEPTASEGTGTGRPSTSGSQPGLGTFLFIISFLLSLSLSLLLSLSTHHRCLWNESNFFSDEAYEFFFPLISLDFIRWMHIGLALNT